MDKRIYWNSTVTTPTFSNGVIVEKEDGFYLDYIKENFGEWADDTIRWSYIPKSFIYECYEKEIGGKDEENTNNPTPAISYTYNYFMLQDKNTLNDIIREQSKNGKCICREAFKSELFSNSDKSSNECRECDCDGTASGDEKDSSKSNSISADTKHILKEIEYQISKIYAGYDTINFYNARDLLHTLLRYTRDNPT